MNRPDEPLETLRRAKAIFADALELPPEQRRGYIDRNAAADPSAADTARSLLDAHDQAGAFFANATMGTPPEAQFEPITLQQIGPYRLGRMLGEGGFGVVYQAEQLAPVRRTVALKLIKPGMDSRQVIDRFEAERQALAMMDHPNIARVFDAGTTDVGRPYFVMELVDGVPITAWCDAHQLPPRERLALLIPVCRAVHHAHQKGIIHRDIKPTNVLVTEVDGRPVPKVIDFGIAKAIHTPLLARSMFTDHRQMVGTPQYMSPEQAGEGDDVDTRADVYSLGVLAYELLTGMPPFDPRWLRSQAYGEIQRVIREDDPPRPSTRLSGNSTPATLAASHGMEPRHLAAQLRGEPDWIVMMCMEKDRERRYQSAWALADDLASYLADEPVRAARPSRWYRARKVVRRHRVLVTAGSIVVVALGAGLLTALWGLRQATRDRDLAVIARNEAVTAQLAESEARAHERQTDQFLIEMFTSIDPEQARGRPVLVRDVLDRAAHQLDERTPAFPIVEASLRYTLGQAYHALGGLDAALVQAHRAMEIYLTAPGAGEASKARARFLVGQILFRLGRTIEAEATLRHAVADARTALGADHADTITAESVLGEALVQLGRLDEAEELLTGLWPRAQRVHGEASPAAATAASTLSMIHTRRGRYEEAREVTRQQLAISRRTWGDESPTTLILCSNLAEIHRLLGQVEEAIALLTEATAGADRVLGPEHPTAMTFSNNRALALQAAGRFDEARAGFEDTIARRTKAFGPTAPQTLLARSNYGICLQALLLHDAAATEFTQVIALMQMTNGPAHPDTLIAENNLAWLKADADDLLTAEAMYRDLLPRTIAALGEESPACTSFRLRYGSILLRLGRPAEAEPLLAAAFAAGEARGVARTQGLYAAAYGVCLAQLHRDAEATPLLLRARELMAGARMGHPRWLRLVIRSQIEIAQRSGARDELEQLQTDLAAVPDATTRPSR